MCLPVGGGRAVTRPFQAFAFKIQHHGQIVIFLYQLPACHALNVALFQLVAQDTTGCTKGRAPVVSVVSVGLRQRIFFLLCPFNGRDPMLARSLLQSQQNSDEALNIKRDADPTFDFIGYLETLPQTSGMYMGNASIIPRNYRKYLYHAYLAYMEANGYRNVLSLKMFGLGLPVMLKEYGLNYEKRHTKQGIQTNLTLKEESYGDWLPKCDDPATT